jgi:hypothetical protein
MQKRRQMTKQGRTQDKAEYKTRQNTIQGRTQDKAKNKTRLKKN